MYYKDSASFYLGCKSNVGYSEDSRVHCFLVNFCNKAQSSPVVNIFKRFEDAIQRDYNWKIVDIFGWHVVNIVDC
jgi:hypothetical protein